MEGGGSRLGAEPQINHPCPLDYNCLTFSAMSAGLIFHGQAKHDRTPGLTPQTGRLGCFDRMTLRAGLGDEHTLAGRLPIELLVGLHPIGERPAIREERVEIDVSFDHEASAVRHRADRKSP